MQQVGAAPGEDPGSAGAIPVITIDPALVDPAMAPDVFDPSLAMVF